jgi:hypothetical protein
VLVGYVPQIPDSDDLDAAAITEVIAGTDYDAPVATEPAPSSRGSAPTTGTAAPARPGWRDRLRRTR